MTWISNDICMYVPPPWPCAGDALPLPRNQAHHALHVLRLERGARVCLFDGVGNIAQALLEISGKNQASLRLLESLHPVPHCVAPMDVILALPRHETMDTVVRQACEMGVARIHPVISARSTIPARVARQKTDHWQRVAIAACEQSRRAHFLEILPPRRLDEVFNELRSDYAKLFFWEEAAGVDQIWPIKDGIRGLIAAIGCEGGWTSEEAAQFMDHGFSTLSLGPLILRVDTAFCTVAALGIHFLRTQSL